MEIGALAISEVQSEFSLGNKTINNRTLPHKTFFQLNIDQLTLSIVYNNSPPLYDITYQLNIPY